MTALRQHQKSRQRTKRLAGLVFADHPSQRRLRIEALEQRQLLSAVTWTGGGSNSNWDNPQNWNPQAVPAAADDVVIDTASAAATVAINSGDAESVKSLTTGGNDTLSITGGSLTVAANSTLSGGLSMTGGSLTVSGAGASLTANGATTVDGASLYASGGSQLLFPAATSLTGVSIVASGGSQVLFPVATSYTGSTGGDTTLEASGAGSRIDLSHLQTFAGGGHVPYVSSGTTHVLPINGGEIDLAGAIGANPTGGGGNDFTLDNTGGILNLLAVTQISGTTLTAANGATWTIPPTWNSTLGAGTTLTTTGTGSQFINLTQLNASGGSVAINTSSFINEGVLDPIDGGSFTFNSSLSIANPGILAGSLQGTFHFKSDLLGNTQNADQYNPLSTVVFDGAGTAAAPQRLEVMGRDLGLAPSGFTDNFVYNTLALASNTYVRLVDQSQNTTSGAPEALYVDSLIVPAGTTLDLNGLHLYARDTQIAGTVVNGTQGAVQVQQLTGGGPLALAAPAPANMANAGELDDWTFFGRAGRAITVAVNPGGSAAPGMPSALSPALNWVQVQLLDPSGKVLATASDASAGTLVELGNITLPADGTYTIAVRAPASQSASTGNYVVAAFDATANVQALNLNQQAIGNIATIFSVDQWTFAAGAGRRRSSSTWSTARRPD
jgi:hypothetical protein